MNIWRQSGSQALNESRWDLSSINPMNALKWRNDAALKQCNALRQEPMPSHSLPKRRNTTKCPNELAEQSSLKFGGGPLPSYA